MHSRGNVRGRRSPRSREHRTIAAQAAHLRDAVPASREHATALLGVSAGPTSGDESRDGDDDVRDRATLDARRRQADGAARGAEGASAWAGATAGGAAAGAAVIGEGDGPDASEGGAGAFSGLRQST